MVHAMWSSCSIKKDYYERVNSVESDVKSNSLVMEEEEEEILLQDNTTYPDSSTIQLTELHHRDDPLHKKDPQSKLSSREDSSFSSAGEISEAESLMDHHGHKRDVSYVQPVLERTSIVGQSLEGYGRKTGTMVALTMVASALW